MKNRILDAWRRMRRRFWLSLAVDVAAIIAIFVAVHAWQTRSMPIGETAPVAALPVLDGAGVRTVIPDRTTGVVYFFAPWCGICRQSIGNVDALVEQGSIGWATAIALDYGHVDSVRAFVEDTGLRAPVLLGDADTAAAWGVRAFPTYFVIDENGNIDSRSVGYSTRLGMWTRAWLAP